jgi:iron complex outermembrane receptor protein
VPEFTAQAYTGSFDMRRTALQYAGRIGDYGLVADYSAFDTNGFRDNSQTKRTQFNGKLSFNPNDQTQVNVVFNQFDMPLAQDPLGLSPAQVAANPRQAVTSSAINPPTAASLFVRKITSQNQIGSSATYTLVVAGMPSISNRMPRIWVWVWARCVSIDTSRKIIPYVGMTLYCDF